MHIGLKNTPTPTMRRGPGTRRSLAVSMAALCVMAFGLAAGSVPARAQKKDYLTSSEADKIRDADTPSERVRLLLSFASDRIKKLQYEISHTGDTLHRADRVNALINGYSGCLDDASELIDLSVEKQQDVRQGIKAMQSQAPEFLSYLKDLAAKNPEQGAYKDNLDDAVDATNDAIKSANEAARENAPPPVRRAP
jgi:hypothetical protein